MIDPYSSVYVKRIFNEFLSGKPIHNITLDLTKDGIPTPSAYRNIKNTQKIVKVAWNDVTIRRILKNEVYIGHTIQNKKQKVNYKIKKQRSLPKSEWIKKENTHEPIIALKDFQMVQQILENRSYIPKKRTTHLLTEFLFCNHCGSRFTYLKRHEKGKFYCICNVAKNYRKLGKCDMICIKEEEIVEQIKVFLQDMASKYLCHDKMVQETYMKQMQEMLSNKIREKQFVEGKIQESNNIAYELYKDKITHTITEEQYLSLQLHTNEKKEKFEKQLQIIEQEILNLENMQQKDEVISHALEEFLFFKVLDRNILSILIDKILVYRNDSGENILKIYCKFQSPK